MFPFHGKIKYYYNFKVNINQNKRSYFFLNTTKFLNEKD